MPKILGSFAAVTFAALLSGGPAGAVQSLPQPVTFDTTLEPQYYGVGAYEGVLHLTFGRDGTVSGWYRSVDVGVPRTVVGGLDGNKLWLDLGGNARSAPIQATYENGKIVGSTYRDGQPYAFSGIPVRTR